MPVATPTIGKDGTSMPPTYQLLSIDVRLEVNRIPSAEIRLIDGNVLNKYAVTDGPFFTLGDKITIDLRYEGTANKSTPKGIFEGIVVRQTLSCAADGSTLVVVLKDVAVKLMAARKSAVYPPMTDDAIITQLLKDAEEPALLKGTIAPTSIMHSGMVQYDCTPWDFICLRAEALGMLVTVDAGAVSLTSMARSGSVTHPFMWGTNMYEFEIEAAAEHPYGALTTAAWDPMQKKLTNVPTPGSSTVKPPGNRVPATVAMSVGRDMCQLKHPVPAEGGELQAWADARLSRSILAMVRGRISIPGDATIKLLDAIKLQGVGSGFNGTSLVTAVHHRYDRSGWRTDVQFGLSPERLCQREDIAEVPAAGLLPPVRGLQIGVVAAFEKDPKRELRVKVILPGIADTPEGAVWARLATMDAGADHGSNFRPEPGDEVVVGFLFDDPRHPVILGSMFGSKNTGPHGFTAPDELNERKGIITKKGTRLLFIDEKKPGLRILTESGNSIVIGEEAMGITLEDQHGNSIVMNSAGITIDAGKGNVSIKGMKVDVS